jgi:vesicle coat complex subunit
MTEYKIKKTFPIYDNIICIPVEDVVYGINDFEIFISKYKTIMPLIEPKITENWDVFEFNDDVNIISNTAKKMYKIKDEVS